MIPILYDSNEVTFTSNGLGRLRDCISCVVTEERNGIYECDFEYPMAGANFDKIKCGRIIAVTHEDSDDVQPFDIVSYSKPINGIVTFHAVHISYRLRGYVVSGTNINSLSDALTALSGAVPSNQFSYSANFSSTGYMSAFDGTPRSVRQLLGGVEGSILDAYGGEYEWDRFMVKLHASRGKTVDFSIRYGVNMLDYDEEVDFSNSYTSAVPFWKGDDGNGGQTIVKGNKVSSGLAPYNGLEKCAALDLSEKFENKPTTAEVEAMALNMMTSKVVNMPKQSINVDFVRIQDFNEYENLSSLLSCKLCDSIEVIFPYYDMRGYFKIVKTVFNVLTERYEEMELGSLSTTLAEALGVGEGSSSGGGGGGASVVSTTATLTSGGWTSKTQTVAVAGVTTTNNVIVSYAPADRTAWINADIYCSAQGTDSLTFKCNTTPSADLTANVLII